MKGKIYLIDDNEELVEMEEREYEKEIILQNLISDYPNLLAGEQINSSHPRRWLLISQEMTVPSAEEEIGRWFADHLFLDQDAIPTIVEVKRSSDTRIRREVIGQMLDYAANAVVYWPVEKIISSFENTCQDDPAEVLSEFLGPDGDVEDFWLKVKTNLQAGKVRMLFVADEIPKELKRVIEFLNEQMDPAEVLAIEIKQFVGQGVKTLVPRVVGQTSEAQQKKSATSSTNIKIDEKSFFEELKDLRGIEELQIAEKIREWAVEALPRFQFNKNQSYAIFWPVLDYNDQPYWPIGLRTDGKLSIIFQYLKDRTPFNNEELRMEFLNRLNQIEGIDIDANRIGGRPHFPLIVLQDDKSMQMFIETLQWVVDKIKES